MKHITKRWSSNTQNKNVSARITHKCINPVRDCWDQKYAWNIKIYIIQDTIRASAPLSRTMKVHAQSSVTSFAHHELNYQYSCITTQLQKSDWSTSYSNCLHICDPCSIASWCVAFDVCIAGVRDTVGIINVAVHDQKQQVESEYVYTCVRQLAQSLECTIRVLLESQHLSRKIEYQKSILS